MKPDYKNWVPKGMVVGVISGSVVTGALFASVLLTDFLAGKVRIASGIVLGILFAVLAVYSAYSVIWYRSFSYNGKKQLSRRIIEKLAEYVVLPEGGKGLDIGCGSGALTNACAKRNPKAHITGLDRWGREYASFNKPLCEKNAEIEGVGDRTDFVQGDACKLSFPDESFDAVTSNYCVHNIPSRDRQAILLENLRVLKKGGTFAFHDIFTPSRYGDMDAFIQQLKDMGYEKAELYDTTDGLFMSPKEAKLLCLAGSKLLIGKK